MPELRRALRAAGVKHPLWCEVPKAKEAQAQVRRALKAGVDVVFAWGGDGMVRRGINEMAGTKTRLAVLPAGTSNLFARSLGIPSDIAGAVEVGLHGVGREVDVGTFNGEELDEPACMAAVRAPRRHRQRLGLQPALVAGELLDRIDQSHPCLLSEPPTADRRSDCDLENLMAWFFTALVGGYTGLDDGRHRYSDRVSLAASAIVAPPPAGARRRGGGQGAGWSPIPAR